MEGEVKRYGCSGKIQESSLMEESVNAVEYYYAAYQTYHDPGRKLLAH